MALPQLLLKMAGLRIPRIRRARRMFLPTIQKTKVSTLIKKGAIQMMAQDYKRLGQMTRSLVRVQRAAKGITIPEMDMLENRAEQSVAAAELMEEDKPEEAFAVAPEIQMDRDSNYIANQGGKVAVGVDVEIINPDTLEKKKVTWTQTAIDRLKDELGNDPTGSVREMLKHQKARLSAYRWMSSHNTPNSSQKAINEFIKSNSCA